MAKIKEQQELKKGESKFHLVGKALVNDYTFNIDSESKNSPYTYSSMKLGVETPNQGTVFGEMMGGFSTDPKKKNVIYVHGKKMNDNGKEVDDYQTRWEMDWDDRLNESMYEEVGRNCFIEIGVEKDAKDKTFYKQFLSEYDAIAYLKEHLEQDMVVSVSGDIVYSQYDGSTQSKKQIKKVVLSKLPEEKHGAFFTQTILVDSDSVEKLDKEKMTYGISANVVDYVSKPLVDGKKVDVKGNVVYPKRFELEHKDDEKTAKLIKKLFGAKKDEVWELTVEGVISKGASLVTVTVEDLPEDIQELIEYGAMTEEEALEKCVGKGSKTETFVIQRPKIKVVEKDGAKTPLIEINKDKYSRNDYVTFSMLLENAGVVVEAEAEEEIDEDELDLDALMDDLED